MEPNML